VSARGQGRVDAPAFLLSLLLNLGIVYGVGTALLSSPPILERIEVDLRERPPPPPLPRSIPPQVSRPPEAPAAVPLPRPSPVPQKISLNRAALPSAPRPSVAPAPIPVPLAPPSPVAVPLRLARPGPPAPAPVTPAQASVAPSPLDPPAAAPARGDPDVLNAYFAEIRARIEAEKRYPRWARRARVEGRTTIAFRLGPDGALLEVEVRESSGSDALDRAAVSAVERAAPYPPYPREAGAMPGEFAVTVAFVLE